MKQVKILLISSDETIKRLLSYSCSAEGWHIFTAESRPEGINKMERESPDLVILDTMLADTEGFEDCRKKRESTQVPVIVLNDSDKTTDKIKCFDLGVDDYITKPLNIEELIARIKVCLKHSKSDIAIPATDPFICDDIKVDFQKRQVFVENKEVTLTPIEYRLLVELVSNAERVLTFQELLTKVWGSEYSEDRDYLYVQISRLRGKLERDPKNPQYIINVPRVGYKFLI